MWINCGNKLVNTNTGMAIIIDYWANRIGDIGSYKVSIMDITGERDTLAEYETNEQAQAELDRIYAALKAGQRTFDIEMAE